MRKPRLVALGIVISAFSDMADGIVARVRGSRSDYARQLDTIADSAILLSAPGWLALARSGSLMPLRRTLGAIAFAGAMLLTIEWRRYHMFGALHIDSARVAAVIGHLYVLDVLWSGRIPKRLLRCFQIQVTAATIESAWVILVSRNPNDRSARPLLDALIRRIVQ